jgi:hypothetical protein
MHPKTEKLLSDLRQWCDTEPKFGRRSEAARQLGTTPSLLTDWLMGRRVPSLDQGFMIQDFLQKQKRRKSPPA